MDRFEWSERFSVGVEEMDTQHKQIVRMINLLITTNGISDNPKLLESTLARMSKYAAEHLSCEEQLLAQWHFPERAEHAESHREFREHTASFCLLRDGGSVTLSEDILTYLCSWWKQHILVEDMKYRVFLEELGVIEQRKVEST